MSNNTPHDPTRPRNLQVHIRYRNRRFFSTLGCAVSAREIWFDTHHRTLPTGTMIDLEFQIDGRDWVIPAIVTQHSRHDVQVSLYTELPVFISSAPAISNETDCTLIEPLPVLLDNSQDCRPSA